jgi:hypothetical protein
MVIGFFIGMQAFKQAFAYRLRSATSRCRILEARCYRRLPVSFYISLGAAIK